MARIQILELPMRHVGEVAETPYILIVDQCEAGPQVSDNAGERITGAPSAEESDLARELATLSHGIGAQGWIVTEHTLDVA